MMIYEQAVSIAKLEDKWHPHPNKKRKTQEIQLVKDLGSSWISENPKEDVELIACVVHDTKDDEYYVFMTTDVEKQQNK